METSETYKSLLALIHCSVVVQAVDRSFDCIGRRLQVAVQLLYLLIPMQAFCPAHLVLIDHFEAAIAAVPIHKGVNHRYFAHAFGLNRHRHHVIGTRLVEADVDDRVTALLKQLDTGAEHVILDGSVRLVILSESPRGQAQLEILQKLVPQVQLKGRGKVLQLVQAGEEVAHVQGLAEASIPFLDDLLQLAGDEPLVDWLQQVGERVGD